MRYCKATPMTAATLINQGRCNRTGTPARLEDLIFNLPGSLSAALDAVLAGFDYKENLESDPAIGCRILAAIIGTLEDRLKELKAN